MKLKMALVMVMDSNGDEDRDGVSDEWGWIESVKMKRKVSEIIFFIIFQ